MKYNERFFLLFEALKSKGQISTYVQLADILGTNKAGINDLKSDRKKISLDNLVCMKNSYPNINLGWVITGDGEMFIDSDISIKAVEESTEIEPVSLTRNIQLLDVPIVDISAAAGYGSINPDYAEPLGVIKLPANMIGKGLHYCIRIKGFSMSPTLQDSDYLVIKYMHPSEWSIMPDQHVYVVVDKDGSAYVKRVKNRFNKGFIVLTSDSIDKANYPNFNLQADEINNVFHAVWHFSAKMQNVNEVYYNRLKALEDTVEDMKEDISNIKRLNK